VIRWVFFSALGALAWAVASGASAEDGGAPGEDGGSGAVEGPLDVYVVPVSGPIDKANLYVIRRGLKQAIANDVEMVLLDMDTPGGRVDLTLEIMDMLERFEGRTATYVNDDAISAGSFIAAATDEIYFAPGGKMGASAVISSTGQDIGETARAKIESYLRANIRAMSEEHRYRAEVIRAMLDIEYELKLGEEVIKPAGELLTLTAKEAVETYGEPPVPLIGAGIYDGVDSILESRFRDREPRRRSFQLTYSENLAKWMNSIAPALMGLGLLALMIEFKTPGFGVFGIGGLVLLGIFFLSNYIAGLAGNEAIVIFAIGLLLLLLEFLLFTGSVVFGVAGLVLMGGSMLWAMVDYWPTGEGGIEIKAEMFAEPVVDFVFGITVALVGAVALWRFLPHKWLGEGLVLSDSVASDAPPAEAETPRGAFPEAGERGRATTDLFPSGMVEVGGRRFDARSRMGQIERGAEVRVTGVRDGAVVVEVEEER